MFEKKLKKVVTFKSTEDAMNTEKLCKEKGISGRIIPVPVEISADCGMAWMMEMSEEEKFKREIESIIKPQGYHECMLRG